MKGKASVVTAELSVNLIPNRMEMGVRLEWLPMLRKHLNIYMHD